MSSADDAEARSAQDPISADDEDDGGETAARALNYVLGLILAIALTIASFWAAGTHLIYGPGIPVAIAAFAIAQMGIHLVFFLHITTSPDNTNNVLALAFGILIVSIVTIGSLWIMAHLDHNMMPMSQLMKMQS